MSDTLASEVKASITWLFQDELELGLISDTAQLAYRQTLVDGTGDNQADKVWHVVRTLAAGANEDLILSSLAWSIFDNSLSIALAKVKAILLINTSSVDGENLVLGGASSHEWQGPFAAAGNQLVIAADACLLLINKHSGWEVAAGSADRLRIANSGTGDITYKIAVLGTSA